MIYIVTGTPGTGKTTFAKALAEKESLRYIDGKQLIKEKCLSKGYDEVNQCDIVDEEKFALACEKNITEINTNNIDSIGVIIDSHLSHFINHELVDKCFVTECDLKELENRLKLRGYFPKKIADNLEAEAFKVCRMEAKEEGHDVEIIYTTS